MGCYGVRLPPGVRWVAISQCRFDRRRTEGKFLRRVFPRRALKLKAGVSLSYKRMTSTRRPRAGGRRGRIGAGGAGRKALARASLRAFPDPVHPPTTHQAEAESRASVRLRSSLACLSRHRARARARIMRGATARTGSGAVPRQRRLCRQYRRFRDRRLFTGARGISTPARRAIPLVGALGRRRSCAPPPARSQSLSKKRPSRCPLVRAATTTRTPYPPPLVAALTRPPPPAVLLGGPEPKRAPERTPRAWDVEEAPKPELPVTKPLRTTAAPRRLSRHVPLAEGPLSAPASPSTQPMAASAPSGGPRAAVDGSS